MGGIWYQEYVKSCEYLRHTGCWMYAGRVKYDSYLTFQHIRGKVHIPQRDERLP